MKTSKAKYFGLLTISVVLVPVASMCVWYIKQVLSKMDVEDVIDIENEPSI